MDDAEKAAIEGYDWSQHVWTGRSGGYNPSLVPWWREVTAKLLADPTRYDVTTDGGVPRVGWCRVLRLEFSPTWPYSQPVPHVVCEGWDGIRHYTVMGLGDIRETRAQAA